MTNLSDVDDSIYVAFNQEVVKHAFGGKRVGIHVTDLVEPKCIRNVYYGKRFPMPQTGETAKQFYGGQMVHSYTELATVSSCHELEIIYDPIKDTCLDVEKTKKEHPKADDPFWLTVITGSIDDVIKLSGGDYIIADKKTKLSKPETILFGKQYDSIKPIHKSQLNIYRLMLYKKTGIDAKYGCILSLDFADKFVSPKPQPFELDNMDNTRTNLIHRMELLVSSLQKGKLPPRDVSKENRWMCDRYCGYYSWCFDGEGKNI